MHAFFGPPAEVQHLYSLAMAVSLAPAIQIGINLTQILQILKVRVTGLFIDFPRQPGDKFRPDRKHDQYENLQSNERNNTAIHC
jgi:hypothetical protein